MPSAWPPTWAVTAPGTEGSLRAYVLAGLLFNIVPAAVNAVLFAAAVPAVVRASLASPAAARGDAGPAAAS